MKKDRLGQLFERLEGEFDVFETPEGHQKRFMNRLQKKDATPSRKVNWIKVISIAAVFALLVMGGNMFLNNDSQTAELASVSPEMEQTQSYFAAAIQNEIQTMKSFDSPETELLIKDALHQIDLLEKQYQNLTFDLVESGYDQRVIYAMINNFQKRIDLLEDVTKTIKEIKNLNNQNNENTI